MAATQFAAAVDEHAHRFDVGRPRGANQGHVGDFRRRRHEPRVSIEQRLAHMRGLLSRVGTFSFDDAVKGADRVTEAVTLFALLELYKAGEADWEQSESFGPITIKAGRG